MITEEWWLLHLVDGKWRRIRGPFASRLDARVASCELEHFGSEDEGRTWWVEPEDNASRVS
jgi:hypothetical protein